MVEEAQKGTTPKTMSKGTKKEHIWLRSHNVGSIRAQDRREKAFDANIDVFALQENSADIKTMHDAKAELSKKQFRTIWSEPMEINKQGGGALVAAAVPLYCTQLIDHTLETEIEELVDSTRLAASWIQTHGINNGIAVISFYGISGSNADFDKRMIN